MLVPIPIGLWLFSFICDVIYSEGWGGPIWNDLAYYTMVGGVIGALLAAVPGLIDYFSITSPRAKAIGSLHLSINLILVALYGLNLWLRTTRAPGAGAPVVLSFLNILLLWISGWLGGEMVFRYGLGVDPSSKLHDSPNPDPPLRQPDSTVGPLS